MLNDRIFRHAEQALLAACEGEQFDQLPEYLRQTAMENAERHLEQALKAKMLSGAPISTEALTLHHGAIKLLQEWQQSGGPYPCIAERFYEELPVTVPAAWRFVNGERVHLLDDSGKEWAVKVVVDSGHTWNVRVQTETGYIMGVPRQRLTGPELKEANDLIRRRLTEARACGGSVSMITPQEHSNLVDLMGKARLHLEKLAGNFIPPRSSVADVLGELDQTVAYLDRCVNNYSRANGPTQLQFSFGL